MRQYSLLPNDRPKPGLLLALGLQHVLAMFPATVLVALLCGFHVGTVLLAAGLATLVALTLSRNLIGTYLPLFYGSSFSYIAAYFGVAQAMGHTVTFGEPLPDDVLGVMQAGILITGMLNIAVGFTIRAVGKRRLDRVLPPIVTGPVACVIGFALAKAALDMSFTGGHWLIALLTLGTTVAASHLLQGRGVLGMVPLLLGAGLGYLVTLATVPGAITFSAFVEAPMLVVPHITVPVFSGPLVLTAVFSISIMMLATLPESTAHLYQMSIYVDNLAEERGEPKPILERHIGVNLVCDGVGDAICGLIGGPAGTNYGENNSLMVITKNYSGRALLAAGLISIALAFVGKFSALVATVPVFVTGGLAVYLFGVIGMQGIALLQQARVNLFRPLELAVGATIMVVGIGGQIGFPNGLLPVAIPGVFPEGLPAIATAAMLGTIMHLVFSPFRRPSAEQLSAAQVPSVQVAPTGERKE